MKPGESLITALEESLRKSQNGFEDLSLFCQLVRQGDEAATEQLYLELQRRWMPWLLAKLGGQSCEDAFDTAFVRILRGIERLEKSAQLLEWCARIIANVQNDTAAALVKDRQRNLHADLFGRPLSEFRDPSPSPERLVIDEQERRRKAFLMLNAWSALSAIDRELVRRFYWLGENRTAIETALFLTPNQFRLRKSRALAYMQKYVATEGQR